MPLSGGIAMFLGIMLVIVLFAGWQPLVLVLLIGGAALIGIGVVDDWFKAKRKEFPVLPKLLVQLLVAVFAFFFDIRFRSIGLSWFGGDTDKLLLLPTWLSFLLTLFWILGLVNMVNFLDGVDGLAGGVTVFSAMTLFFVAFVTGQELTALIAVVLAGGSLAFLRFNFFPAQLYMGDAGSTFLGYTLAIVSLEGTMKGATLISLVVTILALGLPLMDTTQVMISRLLAGSPMYQADRRHMHHRLMSKGLSARQTVFILYLISFLFSAGALFLFLLF